MDAVPFSQGVDAHPGQAVADKSIDLGGGETSLSRLGSPHHGSLTVPRSAALGAP